MNVSTIIKIFLKAILIPIVTVWGLSKFNVFEYITFIPEDYQYEIGLTVYLALIEALYEFGEKFVDSKRQKLYVSFLNRKRTRTGRIFRL